MQSWGLAADLLSLAQGVWPFEAVEVEAAEAARGREQPAQAEVLAEAPRGLSGDVRIEQCVGHGNLLQPPTSIRADQVPEFIFPDLDQ